MGMTLPWVLCFLLVFSTHGTDGESQAEEPAGSAEVVDASATGSTKVASSKFFQFYKEECHDENVRRYRTADGSCNHVYNLGSAKIPFKRLLPQAYWDNVSKPRSRGHDGHPLPSPTEVSRKVHVHKHSNKRKLTSWYMTWGQFIDHDMDLTPVSMTSSGKIKCCGDNNAFPDEPLHPQCFPIKLSRKDANKRFNGDCMEFVRSVPARDLYGHPKVPREQVNAITAFIDGSMIYGSSEELLERLRNSMDRALMRVSADELLPRAEPNSPEDNCMIPADKKDDVFCFLAGDTRVNVQAGLTSMHTIWVRLHNRIAQELRALGYPEDNLFEETRKIVVAILQHITYNEFLPLVIGRKLQNRYHLVPGKKETDRSFYNPHVDPRIVSSFATAAFRFGHSNIPEHLRVNGIKFRFLDIFHKPELVFQGLDHVVDALITSDKKDLAEDGDRFMVSDITNHLFEPLSQNVTKPSFGLDLPALNIQRGRDHGLPSYNKFRKFCGLDAVTNFSEFGDDVSTQLSSLYRSVDDLDLFTGGLLETPTDDADVGHTFACIIGLQFNALKFGDRFFYETDREKEGFTGVQLHAIRQITGAHVVCKTTGIHEVPDDVFSKSKKRSLCEDLNRNFLNFTLWINNK